MNVSSGTGLHGLDKGPLNGCCRCGCSIFLNDILNYTHWAHLSLLHERGTLLPSVRVEMSLVTFRQELRTFLQGYTIRHLSTTEATRLILPSRLIPLRLCKVPLQCIRDIVTLTAHFSDDGGDNIWPQCLVTKSCAP